MQNKPSIVFVHGIWADGSSFGKLIRPLQAEGYEVMAAQYGLDSLDRDIAAVKQTVSIVTGPTLLVGHSYGGTLVTHAGTHPQVTGLVYIAALSLDAGETSKSIQAKFPTTPIFSNPSNTVVSDGRLWMKPEGIACFAGDLPEAEQKLVWATHVPPALTLFTEEGQGIAWKTKPSWYIVAKNDKTVHPELQRFVAQRMGSSVFETDSSHVPMLSQPEFVLDVIRKAAEAITQKRATA